MTDIEEVEQLSVSITEIGDMLEAPVNTAVFFIAVAELITALTCSGKSKRDQAERTDYHFRNMIDQLSHHKAQVESHDRMKEEMAVRKQQKKSRTLKQAVTELSNKI